MAEWGVAGTSGMRGRTGLAGHSFRLEATFGYPCGSGVSYALRMYDLGDFGVLLLAYC